MTLEETDKRIAELFEEWKGLQPLKPEDEERFNRKLRLDWNYNSNHIEGNTLTYGETEVLLIKGEEKGIHPKRDYMEIKAHDLAIDKIREFANDKNRKLTESDIRGLNKLILKEPFWKEAEAPGGQRTQKQIIPGQYKIQPNHVRMETGEIFKFAEPQEVPPKMNELVEWFNGEIEQQSLSIAYFLAELHHRFIVIHPFDDGNGRVARLWMNYVLLRLGYPPLVIRTEDKRNYFAALQRADEKDMDSLAIYLGNVLIEWLKRGTKAAKGEDIRELGDIHKEVDVFVKDQEGIGFKNLRPLSQEVVNTLYEQYFIKIFNTFEDFFEVFSELFLSKESKVRLPNMKEYIPANFEEIKTIVREYIREHEWKDNNYWSVDLVIAYRKYKGKSREEFDMEARLTFQLSELRYDAYINCQSKGTQDRAKGTHRNKLYSQDWTENEIIKFVEEGKESFFNLLTETAKK